MHPAYTPSWNCLFFTEPWRHECLEIFSSLLNYARRVEMSANVDYTWETVLHETRPHSVVSESLWFWAGGWGWGGGACPPGSGMSHSQEAHLRAVTGTHFWSHDWGRKVRMEISGWKDPTVPVVLPEGYLFIFDVDHFKNLYWICCNIVSILCFDFGLRGMWNLSYLTRMAAGLAPVLNLHPWHWKVKFCVFFFLTFLFCTGV